ncbi:hypothetical protein HY522_03515 [bacterium]|nr:hypothetical protein [bacterium]
MDFGPDPVGDLQMGFRDAINKKFEWNWTMEDTLILSVVVLFFIAIFMTNELFARYRFFIRARRREKKKRAFLKRLILHPQSPAPGEVDLLRRLTHYYCELDDVGRTLPVTQAQMLTFAESLFRMMRRLEFDRKGRLVIPKFEERLLEAARPPKSEPVAEFPAAVRRAIRDSEKSLSRPAQVALNLIRLRKTSP